MVTDSKDETELLLAKNYNTFRTRAVHQSVQDFFVEETEYLLPTVTRVIKFS